MKKFMKVRYDNSMMALFFIYVLGFWAFLHYSGYLPYIFDNNETYSSLVHAYNMYFGDWSKSYGLTDEAFSPFPDAHPTIHTHQGNWPRIFAFILFALGARTAESQIVLHVYTVGLIAIFLAYKFFVRITNKKFAFLACLLFLTDYILFTQWHVVTYRVWHCFFIFSSMNCVHMFNDNDSKTNKIIILLNFATLFYWELVFCFYISVWSLVYYSLISNINLKKTFKFGCLIAAGGAVGLVVLFTQLSMFMGFTNAIQDYYLTFFARNFAQDHSMYRQAMTDFYADKDIAFFYNISDGAAYKTLPIFLQSFFRYGFQIYSPIFTLFVFSSITWACVFYLRGKLLSLSVNISSKMCGKNISVSITTISLLLFIISICIDNRFLGLNSESGFYELAPVSILIISPIISLFLTRLLFSLATPLSQNIRLVDLASLNLYILVFSSAVWLMSGLYSDYYSVIWYTELTKYLPDFVWRILVFVNVFLFGVAILINRDLISFKTDLLKKYLISGLVGYSVIYILSPGYLFTGYLTRNAPFIVFMLVCITSLSLFIFSQLAVTQIQFCALYKHLLRPAPFYIRFKNLEKYILILLAGISSLIMCLVLAFHWFHTQYVYLKIFPPNSVEFMKLLRQPEYQGKSFVSNSYSLPFAYETKYWSYTDPKYGAGESILINNRYCGNLDFEYLWYKNKASYEGYRHPDFYVCFVPSSFDSIRDVLLGKINDNNLCFSNRVIMHVKNASYNLNKPNYLQHKLIAVDSSTVGKWAIVEYNWGAL